MNAEQEFSEAFDRLRRGAPQLLPVGSEVSQNNVAREAGKDASALKKQRFPRLVSQIQAWLAAHSVEKTPSRSQLAENSRRRNRSLRETIATLKNERDIALSLLVEADTVILGLHAEVESLQRRFDSSK